MATSPIICRRKSVYSIKKEHSPCHQTLLRKQHEKTELAFCLSNWLDSEDKSPSSNEQKHEIFKYISDTLKSVLLEFILRNVTDIEFKNSLRTSLILENSRG